MKITNNEGVPAVFDGVEENFLWVFRGLKIRGMMISFGNAQGL